MHTKLQVHLEKRALQCGPQGPGARASPLPPSRPQEPSSRLPSWALGGKSEPALSAAPDVFTRHVQNNFKLWFTSDQEFILLEEA